jgi:putative inorganic carbon (hco3(-)) transporter
MFIAMMLYLLLVLIRPQDYPAMVDSAGLPLQPIMLIIAAVFWLLSPRKNFDAPQYALLLAFFVVQMVSHIFNGWFGGALDQVGKFAPVVLAFAVFANGLDRRERILKTMAAFALCAAVLAIHGIGQQRTGTGWTGVGLSQGTRIQYVGIFNDPNDLGMLFVACIPMAAYLSSRGGWMGLRRLFWLAVTGVLVYGVYLTDSRGSLLALLGILGVYVWQRRGLFVAGALGSMAVAVLLALPSRFSEIDAEEASAQGRVESWYEGLQMFKEHPIFGVGPDMYTDYNPLTAHNSFVLILAETGIIGFTLWLAFVIYCFRMMWAGSRPLGELAWKSGSAPEDDGDAEAALAELDALEAGIAEGRAIAMTLLLSLVGFFISAFFLSRSYVIILYLLMALVVAQYTDMRQDDPDLPRFSISGDAMLWPVIGFGAAIGLYITVKVLLVVQ